MPGIVLQPTTQKYTFGKFSKMPFGNPFRGKSAEVSINEPEPSTPSTKGGLLRRLSSRSSKSGGASSASYSTNNNGQNLVAPSFPGPGSSYKMSAPGDVALESPPTYNEAVAAPTQATLSTTDDQFAFLSTFDTVFLIDDSGSMAGRCWIETSQALAAIAPICAAHDKDGVDVYFMNAKPKSYHNLRSSSEIREVFETTQPRGYTPTGATLQSILRPYLKDCEKRGAERIKPLNIIVITDGVPSDDPESVIIQAAKKLEKMDAPPYQVGIQFFQVGAEPSATEALKELDDGLVQRGCPRDIVDTVPYKSTLSADGMLKVVLGAVNRRLDRKRNSADSRN